MWCVLFMLRLDGIPPEYDALPLNIEGLSLVLQSQLSLDVFPGSFSKGRTPIRGAPVYEPTPEQVYPLRKKPLVRTTRRTRDGGDSSADDNDDDDAVDEDAVPPLKQLAPEAKVLQRVVNRELATATFISYNSKQTVAAGGKSEAMNLMMAYQYAAAISHQQKIHLRVCNFHVENIVCSTTLGFSLDLPRIQQHYERVGLPVGYDRDVFSGLNIIHQETFPDGSIKKWTFVVFESGKVLATGIKHVDHIPIVDRRMHEMFDAFEKQPRLFKSVNRNRMGSRNKKNTTATKARAAHKKQNPADKSYKKLNDSVRARMKTMQTKQAET